MTNTARIPKWEDTKIQIFSFNPFISKQFLAWALLRSLVFFSLQKIESSPQLISRIDKVFTGSNGTVRYCSLTILQIDNFFLFASHSILYFHKPINVESYFKPAYNWVCNLPHTNFHVLSRKGPRFISHSVEISNLLSILSYQCYIHFIWHSFIIRILAVFQSPYEFIPDSFKCWKFHNTPDNMQKIPWKNGKNFHRKFTLFNGHVFERKSSSKNEFDL